MIKVSIIIPVYNASKYLAKCLDSVLNQTLDMIEVIAINDGSTDASKEILDQYQAKYNSKLKVVHKTNEGIGKTRNLGIGIAKGEYIGFVDADDYIESNMLEVMYKEAILQKLDIVVCDFYRYNEQTKVKDLITLPSFHPASLKDNPTLINDLNHAPWNKLYKRSLLMDHNITFEEQLKYEDTPFVLKALKEAKIIGKIDQPFNYYIIHNNSETTTMNQKVFDIFKILDIINNYYRDTKVYQAAVERLNINKLTIYTIQQRYQSDKTLRNRFIDEAFKYLNTNFPDWKGSIYYKNYNFLKALIEKNKILTKLYCSFYQILIRKPSN